MVKKNILGLAGVESIEVGRQPLREEKQLLRRFVSSTVGTLAVLSERRASLGLPPLSDEGEGVWFFAEGLQSTHFTDTLAERLRFSPADFAPQSDKALRIFLQNNPWAIHRYSRDFKLSYQMHVPAAEAQTEGEADVPLHAIIAEILTRPTTGRVELTFGDQTDLPIEGSGNIMSATPLIEALMDDLSLLRDNVTML